MTGLGVWGNLKASVSGWKDVLANLGNLGFRPERWRMDEMGNLTKISGARGVGVAFATFSGQPGSQAGLEALTHRAVRHQVVN